MSTAKTFHVYTFWTADGAPLYVGCSGRLATRLSQHQYKPWFADAASVTFDRYSDKTAARAAEAETIRRLCPPNNIAGLSEAVA